MRNCDPSWDGGMAVGGRGARDGVRLAWPRKCSMFKTQTIEIGEIWLIFMTERDYETLAKAAGRGSEDDGLLAFPKDSNWKACNPVVRQV